MEIKDRILQFIEHKGITRNKFETMCGLPVRYVSNIGKSIQSDAIKKIVLTFPEINLRWLITGEGEIEENAGIKISPEKFRMNPNNNEDVVGLMSILARFLKNQEDYHAIMKEMVAMYERINNK